jgi:uncharacterized damage-inducible protein DinB
MNKLDFGDIFFDSFDTFKVFDDLKLDQVNQTILNTPKTVWQILNHLIIWQQDQLNMLNGKTDLLSINETETWNVTYPEEQELVDNAVLTFKDQIKSIKAIIAELTTETTDIQLKLKCIQEIANHLSFHLGEIILIRRQMKNFPLPGEMKKFLTE